MSDGDLRRSRLDDRRRHDGIDADHPPGDVIHLDPETLEPKTRRNVTAEETAAALELQGSLSWEEQGERVRRLNSILLERITKVIDDNRLTAIDVHGSLMKLSDIAKKWTVEKRAAGEGGDDASKLSDAELERRLKK